MEFTRINNDKNGNPRYVVHFLNIDQNYESAVKKANKIGGRKFHNKQYGGGIVFQSYNLTDLEKKINRTINNLNIMKTTIKEELLNHILEKINEGIIDDTNTDEWHYYCFNEDYYIIGYYQAEQWLKRHDLDVFQVVGICQQYEIDNFGEHLKIYDNAETTVNMLVYIYGEELIYSFDVDEVEGLKQEIENELN